MRKELIKLEYNINGIGIITPIIYPFAATLYSNNRLNVERKLKETNQLGAIRFIHNGAHYTRHEYVLLQIMLINFIKNNSKLGLGSKFNFLTLNINEELKCKDKITGAEILELIVLFANMGHFKDTFSSNKIWFHYVYTNKSNARSGFKKGLKNEGKKLLDRVIEGANFQKIQWINTLYILSRSSSLDDYRLICERIVDKVLSNENNKWLDIYSKIRKVSYVVLDSHFSHIPISISLQNVLFNENLFIDELNKNNSGLIGVFERINDLLEDTLYLENNALLMGTFRSMDIYDKVERFIDKNKDLKDISKINKLILEQDKSPFYEEYKISEREIPWNKEKNLSLTFRVRQREGFPIDVFQKELDTIKKLGSECYVGFNFSPNFAKYRTVYALEKNLKNYKKLDKCLQVISIAIDDYLSYKEFAYEEVNNGPLKEVIMKKIITYLFRNLLKEDYFCEYEYSTSLSPFIIDRGSKKLINKLNIYIEDYRKKFPNDKDGIHELRAIKNSLEKMNYKGLVIIYVGSLKFINKDKKSVCELDGLIFTPKNKDSFLRVVEAKNLGSKKQRNTVASRQLEEKFIPLLPEYMIDRKEIENLEGYGAMVKLKK
ncbi:hypothetical protein ACH0BF_13570 [Pseudobacillus sp. 179-B 2D1 NHS]|uniref:hypothetical protein n=1 Tax=Pseudobacillus sp. 179-B 2D1 NHS TaxID=3374292 RepID=UPI003878FD0C